MDSTLWEIGIPSGYRLMAFVPEAPAPRGALRAAVTPSAGTHARALRPEPGRDSTPLFFRVARARARRVLACCSPLTTSVENDRSGGWMTAPAER